MAFAILDGDPRELEAQASVLGSIAGALDSASSQLGSARDATRETGDNSLGAAIARRTSTIEPLLHKASADMRAAQALLLALGRRLLQLDVEAQIAQHRVEDARRHVHSMPMVPLLQHAVDRCRGDANAMRQAVGQQLEALANDAPAWRAAHPTFLRRFARDVGSIVTETASGVAGLVTGVGGLTVEAVWDRHAVVRHWGDLLSTVGAVAEHPGAAVSGVVKAVVRPDLIESDPLAWIVNVGFLVAGGEILKAPRALGAAGEGAAGVASRLRTAAGGLRFGASGGGAAAALLEQAGIPADRITVLKGDAVAQIGKGWALDPSNRGYAIEEGIAYAQRAKDPNVFWLETLKTNQRGIDLHTFETGKMVSIRSIDPSATSYERASQFRATLDSAIHKLDRFETDDIGGIPVGPGDFGDRHVVIALPDSGLTPEHAAKLHDLYRLWSIPGDDRFHTIDVHFTVVPR